MKPEYETIIGKPLFTTDFYLIFYQQGINIFTLHNVCNNIESNI